MGARFDSHLRALQQFVSQNGLDRDPNPMTRMDADETGILARELEQIETQLIRTRYPDVIGLDYIPLIPGTDPGLMAGGTYTWRRADKRGQARFIADMAADFPRAEIDVSENYTPVRPIGMAYGYTVPEIKAFALAQKRGGNINLETERALAARHFIDRFVDQILAIGAPDFGTVNPIVGLASDSSVSILTPVAGAWGVGSTGVLSATPQQILADIQAMERYVWHNSLTTALADTLLLPSDSFSLLNTPLGVNNDHTILDFVLQNSLCKAMTGKPLNIKPWWQLNTAGAGSVPRAVAYQRDPTVLGALVPVLFEQLPAQPINAAYNIPCLAACGGTVIKFPPGVVYMDGTNS